MSRNIYPIPFAINTYSYTLSHTVTDCLTHLAGQGYTDFELMMYPGHLWPADLDKGARNGLQRQITAQNLRVTTLNMPNIDLNITAAAPEMRAYTLGLLRGVVELAGDLEVPGVIIGPGKSNPLFPASMESLLGHFFRALDELVPLAEKAGTGIYVENMPFAFLPDAVRLMEALERYGNDRIGVVYDVANGVFIKENLAEGLRLVQDRLRLVHLSDTGLSVYRHDPVGLGIVPFSEIPGLLRDAGYTEIPMLEIISPDADRNLRESVDKLLAMGWPATVERTTKGS